MYISIFVYPVVQVAIQYMNFLFLMEIPAIIWTSYH